MAHRYEDIYTELLEAVPELRTRIEAQIEEPNGWERELKRAGQDYSEADLEYLRQISAPETQSKKQDPLVYVFFESELCPLISGYAQRAEQEEPFDRLHDIMDWVEELAQSDDQRTRNLVLIGICETLLGNEKYRIHYILPFMGEATQQMCRELLPHFRVPDKVRIYLTT